MYLNILIWMIKYEIGLRLNNLLEFSHNIRIIIIIIGIKIIVNKIVII